MALPPDINAEIRRLMSEVAAKNGFRPRIECLQDRVSDLEHRLTLAEARLRALPEGSMYSAHFAAHAHCWIAPDGSFGSGGLTISPRDPQSIRGHDVAGG